MAEFLKKFEAEAAHLDAEDPLKDFRSRFALPKDPKTLYLCNNSLGLPAAATFANMHEELHRWSELGVEGWFEGKSNWYRSFETRIKGPLSRLLGADEDEVVVMNSLTVNLHLLLVSFYQPDRNRFKILIDGPTFPSDLYAIKSHLLRHGQDPENALIVLKPREGEDHLRLEDIGTVISAQGESIALVFLGSVNFLTGQLFEMEAIAKLAKSKGCLTGFDLAHAAGNVPLRLHDWGVDFAVGCSYKYLCSGPGGPGIAFVHAKHHGRTFPRLSGWWGNDPNTRFQMQLQEEFVPYGGAASWQVSTPSILSLVPLAASLEVYDEAGMDRFRRKSELQTAYLTKLLGLFPEGAFYSITPKEPERRGCQISLLFRENSEACLKKLEERRVICDFRPPNVIRVTPTPLYNTFDEIYQFACRLNEVLLDR